MLVMMMDGMNGLHVQKQEYATQPYCRARPVLVTRWDINTHVTLS